MSTCIVRIERRLQRLRVAGQSQHRGAFYLSRFFADRKYGGKRKAKRWHWPSCPSSSGPRGGCGADDRGDGAVPLAR